MSSVLKQIKNRRITLGLKQHDMMLRVGISRQQYQQLESKGNPRLNTLELVAKGLKGRMMFIPEESVDHVKAILDSETKLDINQKEKSDKDQGDNELANDPWKNILDDDADLT